MNLGRSIDSLVKRFDKQYPAIGFSNKTGLSHWKGKPIIPMEKWIEIRNTPYALEYFLDDFDQVLTYMLEGELNGGRKQEDVKKWDSDFLELMEYTRNPDYGKLKCFHCLLSPDGDDPIFIGINRLVAKGLIEGEQEKPTIQYPCKVVNRFQCPYERTNIKGEDHHGATNPNFSVEDLFRLQRMAFVVEIALAKARKNDSEIQIKDKQDLLHALTDKDTFAKILQQADGILKSDGYLREISITMDTNYIIDYFMGLKNCLNLDELRFY